MHQFILRRRKPLRKTAAIQTGVIGQVDQPDEFERGIVQPPFFLRVDEGG
ncbi:MAG: hypothetical protein PHV10_06185 [Sulfuricurvum sp.]|nr:hypothetical protein [Sulfuricurvum sp.]